MSNQQEHSCMDWTPSNMNDRDCKVKKAVQFSPAVDITFIEHVDINEAGSDQIWYSDEDFTSMQQDQVRSLSRVHFMVSSSASPHPMNDEHVLDAMTGLENLLQIKAVRRNKLGCLHAVLDEQDRQDEVEMFDADRLAAASRQFSIWADKRAAKIGANQCRAAKLADRNNAQRPTARSTSPQSSRPSSQSRSPSPNSLLARMPHSILGSNILSHMALFWDCHVLPLKM